MADPLIEDDILDLLKEQISYMQDLQRPLLVGEAKSLYFLAQTLEVASKLAKDPEGG